MRLHRAIAMVAAMISVFSAGASLTSFDNPAFIGLMNVVSKHVYLLFGFTSIIASIAASFLFFQVMRRSRLRRRARRVFIIYTRQDAKIAREISHFLRENGVEPWLDTEQISAGQVWRGAIRNALSESALAIVLLTKNATSSEYVRAELKAAIQNMEAIDRKTSPIIPVLFEGGKMPSSLSHIQCVDMSAPESKDFLLRSIQRAMDRIVDQGEVRKAG